MARFKTLTSTQKVLELQSDVHVCFVLEPRISFLDQAYLPVRQHH